MPAVIHGAEVTLGRRQLYMLPTRFGLTFALLIFVLLLASINYSNGLAYGLTFLLAAMAVVSMLHTHRNLSRLRLVSGYTEPVFAGEFARFPLWVHNDRGPLRLDVDFEQRRVVAARSNIPPGGQARVYLGVRSERRGYLPMPAFRVATRFPLGLLYSWSRGIQLEQQCLVYPRPGAARALPTGADEYMGREPVRRGDGDDFAGLRQFRTGDPPQHVNWKAVAAGRGMYTKEFKGGGLDVVWFDWDRLDGLEDEARLSQLCRWILDAEQEGLNYGLRLPALTLAPANGPAHRHACLRALALFPRIP